MTLKIYIAGPLFNAEQQVVMNQLDNKAARLGAEVFNPYRASREIWAGRAPKDCTAEDRAKVLEQNVQHLFWCDVLWAWVGGTEDGRVDTGACWEMGYVAALSGTPALQGRPGTRRPYTVAFQRDIDADKRPLNLMLAGTVDALVTGRGSADEAMALLVEKQFELCSTKFSPTNVTQESEPIR